MIVLQIEHKIANYNGWKKAFDSDPVDRKKSGVKHYRIYKPTDDPNYIVVDLEFENITTAQMTLESLKKLWEKVEGTVMVNPKFRILEIVDYKEVE